MITLDLSMREVDVIRQALRSLEEQHKKHDFRLLVTETSELRSKVNDTVIEYAKDLTI